MQVDESMAATIEKEILKTVAMGEPAQQLLKRYLRLQRELFRADHSQLVNQK